MDICDHDGASAAELPCAAALFIGTMALMTFWANPEVDSRIDAHEQRALLARKIVSNLACLSQHPAAMPGLRNVAAKARERWLPLANACQEGAAPTPQPNEPAPFDATLH